MPAQCTTKPLEFEGWGRRLAARRSPPTAPSEGHPPGSAGVPPASLFLQTSLPSTATPLQSAPNRP